MYDLLIKGGSVVDGTGNPWFRADVALLGGRIAAIGRELSVSWAHRILDATGKVVTPGFVDTHTHSDFAVLADPLCQSKVQQGVTTEIVGNCGMSASPAVGDARATIDSSLTHYGIPGLNWGSMAGYLERLERHGVAINVAALIGFSNLRASVIGYGDVTATPEHLAKMRALIARDMEEGALGLSTGLFYAPQSYASEYEVTDAASALRSYGGVYVTHIRDEGNYKVGLRASLAEAFRTARAADAHLHISHLQANGIAAWGSSEWIIPAIEHERGGSNVTVDVYPYTWCGGGITGSVMPRWALAGGRTEVLRRLANSELRAKIASEIAYTFSRRGGPELHVFSHFPAHPEYVGLSLLEVAARMGEPAEHAVLSLLEDGEASWVSGILDDQDVAAFITQDWAMIGSDGSAIAPTGPTSGGLPHPRNYGTFPRVIAEYSRRRLLFDLPAAIRKMTSLPAQQFGLSDRGLVKEGFWADLVVFDAATVADTATYSVPHSFPTGIDWVLVNGLVVVDHGVHTQALPGMALRRR